MNPVTGACDRCRDVNRRRDQLLNVRIISPRLEVRKVLGEGLVQGQAASGEVNNKNTMIVVQQTLQE